MTIHYEWINQRTNTVIATGILNPETTIGDIQRVVEEFKKYDLVINLSYSS